MGAYILQLSKMVRITIVLTPIISVVNIMKSINDNFNLSNFFAHFLLLASYPGSKLCGGGKESLVPSVCACAKISLNSGKL